MRKRPKRKPQSIFEQEMRNKKFRQSFEAGRRAFELEVQILNALENEDMSLADLARKLGVPRSNISRDLAADGIKRATLPRLIKMADAADADFIPLILPRKPSSRRHVIARFEEVFA